MPINYKEKLDRKKFLLDDRKQEVQKLEKELSIIEKELSDHERVRIIFKQAALLTQNSLSTHIGAIVTRTIASVFFEKDIEFKAEFVERRNKTECDLYIVENEERYDLLDDRGHGMADIASMALRVAYISLDNCDNVLIMDEPFRNLDADRQPYASKLISELSKELDMQFIISTHIQDLISYADNHIMVKIKNGESLCRQKKIT